MREPSLTGHPRSQDWNISGWRISIQHEDEADLARRVARLLFRILPEQAFSRWRR
jgi:hypothetical protein